MDDGAVGSVGVLGTLTFDGIGAVSGNLTITAGDTGQWSCADTFTTGTYTLPAPLSGPGLGTLVIPGAVSGVINFNLVVPSPEGKKAEAVESDNGPPSAILCTGVPALKAMVLKVICRAPARVIAINYAGTRNANGSGSRYRSVFFSASRYSSVSGSA
jgi:hypothetical protein